MAARMLLRVSLVVAGRQSAPSRRQPVMRWPGRTAADQYTVWNTDSNGNFLSIDRRNVRQAAPRWNRFETSFHQDLNGDGMIGVPGTVIEATGSTSLVNVGNHFYLDNISTGSGPSLKYGGADVVAGQFGSGWTPIGAEQTTTGYEVAWKNAAGQYTVWNTDSNGNFLSIDRRNVRQAAPRWNRFETQFPSGLEWRRHDRCARNRDRSYWLDQSGQGWEPLLP